MMKKQKGLLLLIFILTVCLFVSCTLKPKHPKTDADLTSFLFTSAADAGGYRYHVYQENGQTFFQPEGIDGVGIDLENKAYQVDESVLQDLKELIHQYNLSKWDGFNQAIEGLYDGHGFYLEVEFDDETTITADGYGRYPNNYEEVSKAIHDYFDQLIESILNANTNTIIFEYQYGSYNSGYWEYSIYQENEKTMFKAEGFNGVELNVEYEIDNSVLEPLHDLIKQHRLTKWNGFNKSDDDILDGHSFSLTFQADNGQIIQAYGYECYPKKYKEAHQALCDYLNGFVESAE